MSWTFPAPALSLHTGQACLMESDTSVGQIGIGGVVEAGSIALSCSRIAAILAPSSHLPDA